MKGKYRITGFSMNAPVVIGFVFACVAVQILDILTGGSSGRLLFSVYRSSFTDPLAYLRVFLHSLGHSGWQHLINNMMLILVIGPLLEEKYGSRKLIMVIVAASLATGFMNLLVSPGTALHGASGVVFAMILLASMTSMNGRKLPVTFVLAAVLYLGQQVYNGFMMQDGISQMSHIVGGMVGSAAGFVMNRSSIKQEHG